MSYRENGYNQFLSKAVQPAGNSVADDTDVNIEPASSTVQNHGQYNSDNLFLDWDNGVIEIRDNGQTRVRINKDVGIKFFAQATVWDDMRITPGSFDRPGASDPAYVAYTPSGSGTATYLPEFAKNDIASFTIQLPHGYKEGSDLYVHVHWTPGARGTNENGNKVGWKVDYSWANINGTFGAMTTADLSDACDGTNHKHQMSPMVKITGTSKEHSSMLICNIKRTDTGTDDTWVSTTSGQLPLLLEVDFHLELNSFGEDTLDLT